MQMGQLMYNGRVIAGTCGICKMAVWLKPGEKREPMVHGMCASKESHGK